MHLSVATIALAAALAAASGALAQAVQPGEWTLTTTIQAFEAKGLPPGMAEAMKQPTTSETCVTPEKAAKGFQNAMDKSDCPTKSMTLNGGVLDAQAVCKAASGGTRTMHFHGPYTPTGYSLTVDTVETGARPKSIKMTMVAKRTGACH